MRVVAEVCAWWLCLGNWRMRVVVVVHAVVMLVRKKLRIASWRMHTVVMFTWHTGAVVMYLIYYRPQQSNIFTSVCQEFCPQGRGATWAGTSPRQIHLPGRYTPRQVHPGRYIPLPPTVQDFPEEGAPTTRGGANIRFCQNFPKNCMKLKEFGPPGGVPRAPLRSATAVYQPSTITYFHVCKHWKCYCWRFENKGLNYTQ